MRVEEQPSHEVGERRVPSRILPAITLSQLTASSVWFAGNAVMPDLIRANGLPAQSLGDVTTAVQAGFITGTLVFAILSIADRVSPRRVFLVCALLGAAANGAASITGASLPLLLASRFATGFCLAGIYPVGMRIAAAWYNRDLGRALGFLVGALVLATALPHLIRGLGQQLAWQDVVLAVSAIAAAGGVAMYVLVPDGPYLKRGARFDPWAVVASFKSADFRASSLGYFGHMWELYAFWAFVPVYLAMLAGNAGAAPSSLSLQAFAVIAAGALGCAAGGVISQRIGSARVARAQLLTSGLCCLVSPLAVGLPLPMALAFLVVWGVTVAGDSPQFSAMNARTAPPQLVGSALTIVNCIGFAISIGSIQLLNAMQGAVAVEHLFLMLVPGPALGLLALRRLRL